MPDSASGAARAGFTPERPSGARRLRRALTAPPQWGHVAIGLLVGLLAFGAVQQVRAEDDALLARARRADLVVILDGLTQSGDRLQAEISELSATRQQLLTGADSEQTAREQAESRAQALAILAGTAPAVGPGIQVTISDPGGAVGAGIMISGIQELRDADAEAVQISGADGTQVRVVASTYFLGGNGSLIVSGEELVPPYTITAIGDPDTLDSAVNFVQGFVEQVRAAGGEATVTQFNELSVEAIHEAKEPEYARPAESDTHP